MAAISLKLPDELAMASQQLAKTLGISRTEFILRAVQHELDKVQAELEMQEMAKSLHALAKDSTYLTSSLALDEAMDDLSLPSEKECWWEGRRVH